MYSKHTMYCRLFEIGVVVYFIPPHFYPGAGGGIEYTIPPDILSYDILTPGYFARLSNYDAAESLVSSFRGFGGAIQDPISLLEASCLL